MQPRLKCHYKFISGKNIFFVSSDDIHTQFEGENFIYIYIYIYIYDFGKTK